MGCSLRGCLTSAALIGGVFAIGWALEANLFLTIAVALIVIGAVVVVVSARRREP
jgi:hypothetical protein